MKRVTTVPDGGCTRCGKRLDPKKTVWLNKDIFKDGYTDQPLPEERDQGGFPFGPACARAEIAHFKTLL
jgi:hypothetical protein